MRRRHRAAAAFLSAAAANSAGAHALQERYDLPLPLAYVVAGAGAAVLLTFVLAALLARPAAAVRGPRGQRAVSVPKALTWTLRVIGLLLFALTLAAALVGTRDGLMNLAPTLVWIVAWLAVSFVCAFLADVWPLLDPWRTLHAGLLALAAPLRQRDAAPPLRWPAGLGCWPALALLLAWCWLEVVAPTAHSPRPLGWLLVGWTVVNVAGMLAFGRRNWQLHADVFALVFTTFGRMAPLRLQCADPPARAPTPGQVGFVLALLATVIFDGLHASPAWTQWESLLRRAAPAVLDVNGYRAGIAGLVLVWLGFVLLFGLALRASAGLLRVQWRELREPLALALLPIAAGYLLAHNFSTFLLQGQRVFALLSDPFGWQWDLFGMASFYPDIGWLDARAAWFIAVAAIVGGHAVSVWWSHRLVLAAGVAPRRAALGLLPLTLLMVAYTGLSLVLLASGE